ncbi:MAG: hypothetical protein ACK5FE_10140 [Cyanobacteriota bacterium]|jgi:hypothetical protein
MGPHFSPLLPRVAGRWLSMLTGLGFCGSMALGIPFFGMPMNSQHLAQFQALNRELGKLCSNPPRQALSVCRIHARLVSAL